MSEKKPRFSIVVPCYNEARYIGRTLESLQAQTFDGPVEIIVVDNNCSDETVAIAKSYGVKVVTEPRPSVCWARQAGTAAARGEIVISTDADTIFSPDWLKVIDRKFKSDDYVAVTGPCAYSDGPWWGYMYPKILFGAVSLLASVIGHPFYVTATNIAFRKSAWEAYNTTLTQGGDELELLHDLKKKGKVVFVNSNPVFTSGRRLRKGLIYCLFMTFFIHYFLAYKINKWTGRTVIGRQPAGGTLPLANRWTPAYRTAFGAAALACIAFVHLPGRDTLLEQSFETIGSIIRLIRGLA